MMMKYEVGKEFPNHNLAKGVETCLSETNTALFDILYYMPHPAAADINTWKNGRLKYGVYTKDNIPFFIVEFVNAGWSFDVTTNIFKVKGEARDEWLNQDANIINLFMINADTNIVEAMRFISITPETVEKIKDILEAQTNQYDSAEAVDKKMNAILELLPTSDMIKRTKMISL